jgi:DNA primase
MTRRIPRSFINELVARADIVDVVGARVSLKKAGSNLKGLCPFHDEKTPSFTVSPTKGFFKCFGCGEYGNVIDFVMRYENRSFPEAVEVLADMLHLDIPHEAGEAEPHDEHEALFAVLHEAEQLYRRTLRESPVAIEYLKHRGIDGPTAARFAIGYAPEAWDTVLGALGGTEPLAQKLVQAGLAIRNDRGRTYDRFRDRVMFPIRDSRGRVIGFGGRLLGQGEPKYMNSPETPVFDKGRALYGLYEARQTPGRPDQVIVVEGYLDVVALVQHELGPALATMGTATTAHHVQQLTRLSDRVIFCFDGDRAGRAAAWRALESVLPYGGGGVRLDFLLLPEGEDPDSFVRVQGRDAFALLLADALPLSTFFVQELVATTDTASADGRARLIGRARPLLERLPRGVYRELVVQELAAAAGIDAGRFAEMLDGKNPAPPAPRSVSHRDSSPTRMRQVIKLIAHYPAAAAEVGAVEGLVDVAQPGAELLRKLLEMTAENPKILPAQLVEAFRTDPEGRYLRQLAAESVLDDEADAPAVLRDSLEKIVADYRHRAAREAAATALRARSGDVPPE